MPKDKYPTPRKDLIEHLSKEVAQLLQEKGANTAEMGFLCLMIVRTMEQYGKTNNIPYPKSMTQPSDYGTEVSFKIVPRKKKTNFSNLIGPIGVQ